MDQILIEKFIIDHTQAAANALERLGDEEVAAFLNRISLPLATKILNEMHTYKVAKCLPILPGPKVVELLQHVDLRLAELSLRQCEDGFRSHLLQQLDPKLSRLLQQKLAHPLDTVGAAMNTEILGFRGETTVEETIARGREAKNLNVSQIYVVEADGKLAGLVSLRSLLFEEGALMLSAIMEKDVPKIFADFQMETVVKHPAWGKFNCIPVIDKDEKLIGELSFEKVGIGKIDSSAMTTKDVMQTSQALGELYRIGLTGFLQSVSKMPPQ